jgi:lysophospholipase L1-like esterase
MNINSDGFRDEPFTTKGKKKRIAFIGDSVTEGFGVEIEDRYSDRFGSLFNNEIETLNFGIAGYTTIDELEILKKYIIPSQPDMVVLQVYFNDFARNLNRIAAKKEEPKETVVAAVAKQQQQKNQG